jgi:hypothetical protein
MEVSAGPAYGRPMAAELRTKPTIHECVTRDEYGPLDAMSPRVVEYQPGNGTRYVMVLSPLPEGSERITGHRPGTILAHVQNYGRCVPVDPDEPVSPDRVRRALGCSAADATVLAEAIGFLIGGLARASLEPPALPDDHISAGIDY